MFRSVDRILFMGGVFPFEAEVDLRCRSKVGLQYAANNMQLAMLDGFMKTFSGELEVLNMPFVGSWPFSHRGIWFGDSCKYRFHGLRVFSVGFLNVIGIKHLSRFFGACALLCSRLWESTGVTRDLICIYSVHSPFLWAAIVAKFLVRSRALIVLVVPDLPDFYDLSCNTSILYRALKVIDKVLYMMALKKVDGFVILTEPMRDPLRIGVRPYLVMEGVFREQGVVSQELHYNLENTLFYSGGLIEAYGIMRLVRAFLSLDQETWRLVIAGAGECAQEITEIAERDKRVVYLGELQSQVVQAIQAQVGILINPRSGSAEFTQYSFPSKTIEYMASGKPVAMYRMPGVPDAYYEYVYTIPEGGEDVLASYLADLIQEPELKRMRIGEAARRFVLSEKASVPQMSRVISFMETLASNRHFA